MDRWTLDTRTTAYTAIAQRRAVQMTYKSVICHGDYYDDDDDDDDEEDDDDMSMSVS